MFILDIYEGSSENRIQLECVAEQVVWAVD